MKEKGLSSIVIIIIAIFVFIILASVLFFFSTRSGNTQPNEISSSKPSQTTAQRTEENQNTPSGNTQTSNTQTARNNTAKASSSPNVQTPDPGTAYYESYTNINFKFSLKYPTNYKFQESFRNYYYIDTNEDPEERVYIFSWIKNAVATSGNIASDKIILSVYTEGYEPNYRIDKNSKEDKVKIDGQEIQKRYGENGKIITVGPISHNGKILVFQNELGDASADQTVFNNILSSVKLQN